MKDLCLVNLQPPPEPQQKQNNKKKKRERRKIKWLTRIKQIKDELLKKAMEGPPRIPIMLQAIFIMINLQKWLHKKL